MAEGIHSRERDTLIFMNSNFCKQLNFKSLLIKEIVIGTVIIDIFRIGSSSSSLIFCGFKVNPHILMTHILLSHFSFIVSRVIMVAGVFQLSQSPLPLQTVQSLLSLTQHDQLLHHFHLDLYSPVLPNLLFFIYAVLPIQQEIPIIFEFGHWIVIQIYIHDFL